MRAIVLRRAVRGAIAVLVAAAPLTCVQDFVSDPSQPNGFVAPVGPSITVTPSGASLVTPGAGVELRAVYRDDDGNEDPGTVFHWVSLNPNIATVDPVSGLVTPVGTGQAAVEASGRGATGYALVTVSSHAPTSIGVLTTVATGGLPLNAIWGSSSLDAWAVGDGGIVLHDSAGTWSAKSCSTAEVLYGVWGTGTNHVIVVGEGGTIRRCNGGTNPTSETAEPLFGVWGASPRDVFAVGARGVVLHHDDALPGDSFNLMESVPAVKALHAVWGTSRDNVFAVGDEGAILRYDGRHWTRMTSNVGEILRAVWGTGPNDVYAVGAGGTIVHYDGGTWSAASSGTAEVLYGVWGTGPSDVYVVGGNGTLRHFDGRSWGPVTMANQWAARGVWGTAAGDLLVVGDSGTVLRGSRGAATRLAFAAAPSSVVAGAPITTTVRFLDARGNVDTSAQGAVALALGVNPTGDSLRGATTVTAVHGEAQFDNVNVRLAATGYTLVAAAGGLGAQSPSFRVTPGPAARVRFVSPPVSAVAGVPFDTVRVAVVDAFGNAVASGGTSVTVLSIPGAAFPVRGTTTRPVVAGVARFDDLRVEQIDPAAAGYRLIAAPAGPLGRDTSASFPVAPGRPAIVTLDTAEVALVTGDTALRPVQVVLDQFANRIVTPPAATWTSLNPAVALVDPSSGVITGAGAGQGTIVALVDTAHAYALATVSTPGLGPVTQWDTLTSGTSAPFRGVWGTSATHVIIVASDGTILEFNGAQFQNRTLGQTTPLYGVWGSGPALEDVWVVGGRSLFDDGVALRFVGGQWQQAAWVSSWPRGLRYSVGGASPVDVWSVGVGDPAPAPSLGTPPIWRLAGAVWAEVGQSGLSAFSIRATAPQRADVAGDDGVYRIDGVSVALSLDLRTSFPDTLFVTGVWGASASDLHAVGGVAYRFNGSTWSGQPLPPATATLRSISGTSATDVYAVGDSGTIVRFDGNNWSAVNTGIAGLSSVNLRSVWVAPTGEVFVVGDNGVVLKGTR